MVNLLVLFLPKDKQRFTGLLDVEFAAKSSFLYGDSVRIAVFPLLLDVRELFFILLGIGRISSGDKLGNAFLTCFSLFFVQ